MKLITKVPIVRSVCPINYSSKLLLLGSCFADNIGAKFDYFKFRALHNPLGNLFQPQAIENLVVKALSGASFEEKELFYLNEQWHSFEAHSVLSSPNKDTTLLALNLALEKVRERLNEATHFFITLGTAWGYKHLQSGTWVANCHKVPQREFEKALSSVDEIKASLQSIIEAVHMVNPNTQVVFTVSPIRHLKDGFIENQRSKAHLIAAVQELAQLEELGSSISYFPAYEIMMDELRDYRFYDKDMIHPSSVAIEYIWEYFRTCWIANEAFAVMEKVNDVQKGIQHRAFNENSGQHQKFIRSLKDKIAYLQKEYPFMDFSEMASRN